MTARSFDDLEFRRVAEVLVEYNAANCPRPFRPQRRFENVDQLPLHGDGHGPFCKLSVTGASNDAGVYVLVVNEAPAYVGECENLKERWGPAGYGSISPRNCYRGGQPTNCRINNRIYAAALERATIELWFRPIVKGKAARLVLEAGLIARYAPPWNRSRGRSPLSRKDSALTIDTLELLSQMKRIVGRGLRPFVEDALRTAFGEAWRARAKLPAKADRVGPLDAHALLYVVQSEWRDVFSDRLPIEARAAATAVQDGRNAEAHATGSVDAHRALRALSGAVDLMNFVGAKDAANDLRILRDNLLAKIAGTTSSVAEATPPKRPRTAVTSFDNPKAGARGSKYDVLRDYLRGRAREEADFSMTFAEIENILGGPLPRSAYEFQAWWANQTDLSRRPQARAWIEAGLKVAELHQASSSGQVRFSRIG